MHRLPDYDQILTDISAYIPDGIVDLTQPLHVQVLREALMQLGYPDEFVNEYADSVHKTAVQIQEKKPTSKKLSPKPRPKTNTSGETGAGQEARKKGLDHIAFKYYGKNGKVMFKSSDDKTRLEPLSKDEKAKAQTSVDKKTPKPSGKSSTKPTQKPAVGKEPTAKSSPYLASAEISQGIYHDEYKSITGPNGKNIDVRQVVDEAGQPIDVSTPEGVKKAHKVLTQRLEKFRPQITLAARLLDDDAKLNAFKTKHPDVKKEHLQKWVGEVGEMKALQELLGTGVQAHMLTASAPKNDIVAFIGDQQRGLKMAFYSVKSTKQGEEPNQLGANVRKDINGYLSDTENQDIPVKIGDQEYGVNAIDYVNMTMDIKSHFFKELSRGHVGRDGVDINGIDPSKLMPSYKDEVVKLGGKRVGFLKQGDFLKNRKVTDEDVKAILDNPNVDQAMIKEYQRLHLPIKNYEGTKQLLRTQITNMMGKGDVSLAHLATWLENNTAEAMEKTGANAQPASDLIAFHMNTKSGFDDSSIGIITAEAAKQEYEKKYGDLTKLTGMDKVKKVVGLSQRSRGVGDVKTGKGYIDPIDNGTPTVNLIHREVGIPDYVKSVQTSQP